MEAYQTNFSKIPHCNWTDEEYQTILKYLQESSAIEATTKVVEQKLIGKTGITAKLNRIKSKVQKLRSTFKGINEWHYSSGAGYLDTKRAEVMQMSSQDQQRNEICCEIISQSRTNYNVNDTENSILLDESQRVRSVLSDDAAERVLTLQPTDVEVSYSSRVLDIKSNGMNNTTLTSLQSNCNKAFIAKKAKEFVKKIKNVNCMQSYAAYLAAFRTYRAEQTEMFLTKLEWERKKQEKQLEMSEKKLELQMEWTRAQIDLKKRGLQLKEKVIEIDEKLSILDMEREERLLKFELDLKYKSELNIEPEGP